MAPGPTGAAGASSHRLDITDEDAVSALLQQLRPAAVIHAAYRKSGRGRRSHHRNRRVLRIARWPRLARQAGSHLPPTWCWTAKAPSLRRKCARAGSRLWCAPRRRPRWCAHTPAAAIVRTSLVCRLDPPDPATKWVVDSCVRPGHHALHRRSALSCLAGRPGGCAAGGWQPTISAACSTSADRRR